MAQNRAPVAAPRRLGQDRLWPTGRAGDGANGLGVRRSQNAALGDDGGDVSGGGDVEGGILNRHSVGRDLNAADVRNFAGGALFDGDEVAGRGCKVDGVEGRGDIERDTVLFGENGERVGADLVGGVAVGGDAVRADDDCGDAALGHEVAGHVVADERGRNVVLDQLPGREARALVERTGLVGEDVDLLALFDGGADDAQSGTIAAGCQCAGIAMGEHGALLGEKSGTECAELAQVGDVLVVEAAGEGNDLLLDLRDGGVAGGELGVEVADLVDAPEDIDGGGAGFGEGAADIVDFGGEGGEVRRGTAVDAKGDAHGGGDANSHGATDDHVLDNAGDLLVVGGKDVGLLERELGLVEEIDAFREPFEGGNHAAPFYRGQRPGVGGQSARGKQRRTDSCSSPSLPPR